MEQSAIKRFIEYCECNLDFTILPPSGYSSAPLCALDSVFSIGVRYINVKNVINNFLEICECINLQTEISTSEVLDRLGGYTPDKLSDMLHNHQRTDTKPNSILKADAYIQFLKVMQKYKIENCHDIRNSINDISFQNEIRAIRGQTSGLTLEYLFILARVEDYVKVDRYIERFVGTAMNGKSLNKHQIIELIRSAAKIMSETDHPGMTPRYLDHIIWETMSRKQL